MADGGAVPFSAAIRSGEQTAWADASRLIDAACQDLRDGELIHGENFTLFAAMSALEIMDPKMDPGMGNSGFRSIDEAIENGAAPIPLSTDKFLDIQCTIDLMDHLLCCEATWHKGHSLAQTVYSCLYILQVDRTSSHALVHSYCRIFRATCNSIISTVSITRTHEEEDIFTAAYGLPLKAEDDEGCISLCHSVEETLARQLRACKASQSKKFEDGEALQSNSSLEEGYCKALLCRIRFRKYFYHALMSLRRPQGRGLGLAMKHIASCLSELHGISESTEFLRSLSDNSSQSGNTSDTTASGRKPVGFDVGVNRRLSAPAPPRAIRILSWTETLQYFEKLLQDLNAVCLFCKDPSLKGILQSVVQFQKMRPDLVARAHLQNLLVQDEKLYGQDHFYDVILNALDLSDDTKSHSFLKDFYANEFVMQLGQLVINLLKVLCSNAAWQRRKLGKLLQDWSVVSIQLELAFRREFGDNLNVSAAECHLQNTRAKVLKHLLMWEQEQTYWIASRFLMLGFELDLYSSSEYCMVYWYLHVVFIKQLEKLQIRMATHSESSKRKGRIKKKRAVSKSGTKDAMVSLQVLLLQCYICLSEGLAMMMAALANEYNTFHMPSVFNTEGERFIQHFELLLKAHVPDHVSYYAYKQSIAHASTSNVIKYNYFSDSQRIASALRSRYSNDPDRSAELRQLEMVAECNRIALNVINQTKAQGSSLKISFEFNQHPCFATAVVRRS